MIEGKATGNDGIMAELLKYFGEEQLMWNNLQ